MKKILWSLGKILIKIAISILFAYFMYKLLAPYAYAERGYFAIGGELIVVIALGISTYVFLDNVDKMPSQKGSKKSAEAVTSSGQR